MNRALLLWLAIAMGAGACKSERPIGSADDALVSCTANSDCSPVGLGRCVAVTCDLANHVCNTANVAACDCSIGGGGGGDGDCNDNNPCTTDTCLVTSCNHVALGGGGCCNVPGDCAPPGNPTCQQAACTQNACSYVSTGAAGCCNGDIDCGVGIGCDHGTNRCVCPGAMTYCSTLKSCSSGCCVAADCPPINAGATSCVAQKCAYTCIAGFADCVQTGANTDGCETSTNTTTNCGGCGRVCAATNVNAQACAAGLCVSTCATGFSNCVQPPAPAADDGCESNVQSDVNHCGTCSNVCPQPINNCQVRACAGSCTFHSTGAAGCCSSAAQCVAHNNCQTPQCSANKCTFLAVPDAEGCCNIDEDCSPSGNPCIPNRCVDNACNLVAVPNCIPDMTVVDLTEPLPDLSTDDTLTGYTLTGGGGCSASGSALSGLWVGLLIFRRKRRA